MPLGRSPHPGWPQEDVQVPVQVLLLTVAEFDRPIRFQVPYRFQRTHIDEPVWVPGIALAEFDRQIRFMIPQRQPRTHIDEPVNFVPVVLAEFDRQIRFMAPMRNPRTHIDEPVWIPGINVPDQDHAIRFWVPMRRPQKHNWDDVWVPGISVLTDYERQIRFLVPLRQPRTHTDEPVNFLSIVVGEDVGRALQRVVRSWRLPPDDGAVFVVAAILATGDDANIPLKIVVPPRRRWPEDTPIIVGIVVPDYDRPTRFVVPQRRPYTTQDEPLRIPGMVVTDYDRPIRFTVPQRWPRTTHDEPLIIPGIVVGEDPTLQRIYAKLAKLPAVWSDDAGAFPVIILTAGDDPSPSRQRPTIQIGRARMLDDGVSVAIMVVDDPLPQAVIDAIRGTLQFDS